MLAKLVSAFVDLGEGRPRPSSSYKELGDRLRATDTDKMLFENEHIEDCWMKQFLREPGGSMIAPPKGHAPKDTLDYLCVQHQKIEWMREAAAAFPATDVFVWMDYGIFNLPGVTEYAVEDFMIRAEKENFIAIPGCWPKGLLVDNTLCWRFCGSVVVAHRRRLDAFGQAIKRIARAHMIHGGVAEWEVNTWARVEAENELVIRWYPADHNGTMLTEYKKLIHPC